MKLKAGDVLLIAFLLAFSLIPSGDSKPEFVVVSTPSGIYQYSIDKDRVLKFKGAIGESIVEVKDGRVRMIDSACPLKLCVKQGWIEKSGEKIICVPNRVVIELRGEGEQQIDAVTE